MTAHVATQCANVHVSCNVQSVQWPGRCRRSVFTLPVRRCYRNRNRVTDQHQHHHCTLTRPQQATTYQRLNPCWESASKLSKLTIIMQNNKFQFKNQVDQASWVVSEVVTWIIRQRTVVRSQHRVCAVSWIIHHGEVARHLGEEVDCAGLAEQLLPRREADKQDSGDK